MDLQDAHVVITGASRGIVAALANEFATCGARLTPLAVAGAAEPGGGAHRRTGRAGRSHRSGGRPRARASRPKHGPVDVLVNNAGVDLTGALLFPMLNNAPRRIVEALTAGIAPRRSPPRVRWPRLVTDQGNRP